MKKPDIPINEKNRLDALKSLQILDTADEESYDNITNLVRSIFDVDIVAISFIDSNRQWFKSICGLDVKETSRDVSFCGHAILSKEPLIIPDARKDDRFYDNPLVVGDPGIRFYAGIPIKDPAGYLVGTLCIIDSKPRNISQEDLDKLIKFARVIEIEFFHRCKAVSYLEGLSDIQLKYIRGEKRRIIFDTILDFLLTYTGSEYGFIGMILTDPETKKNYLKTLAITNIAWTDALRENYEKHIEDGLEFRNLDTLFGYTIRTGKHCIANNPIDDPRAGGLPKGHPDLNSYLGLPIHSSSGELLSMVGLANKPNGYSDKDIANLETIIYVMTSIIESLRSRDVIEDLANKDSLTGCMSRGAILHKLQELLQQKDTEHESAFVIIDVDNFKQINDINGHVAGDTILKQLVRRIRSNIKKSDMIGRLGGDEFVVILRYVKNFNAVIDKVMGRIFSAINAPFGVENEEINTSISAGVIKIDKTITSDEEALKRADIALYNAKRNKHNWQVYKEGDDKKYKRVVDVESRTIKAFTEGNFYCVYQPVYNCKTNKIVGYEALMRCNEEDIFPNDFIPIIERKIGSKALNMFVLEKVLSDMQQVKFNTETIVSINISLPKYKLLAHLQEVKQLITKTKIPANLKIALEVTESNDLFIAFTQESNFCEICRQLQSAGIKLYIDDFGMKHSSLNRVMEVEFDVIKIDKSIVDKLLDVNACKKSKVIIKIICDLAKHMNMLVIAEGVEQVEAFSMLKELGIYLIQGYLISKPMKLDMVKTFKLPKAVLAKK